MTDSNPVLVPAQGDQPEIVELGHVAAENIVRALELPIEHVPTVKRAIADEINSMSSHFTLAFADVRDQYEIELAKIRSTFSFVNAHPIALGIAAIAAFALGALTRFIV